MKLKSDFVTNSSSASYIMTLKTSDEIDLDEFKEKFNKYIEHYEKWHNVNLRFWDGSLIEQSGPDLFEVSAWTSMHNDASDIPKWMQYLMLEHFVNEDNLGFKIYSFRVENDY